MRIQTKLAVMQIVIVSLWVLAAVVILTAAHRVNGEGFKWTFDGTTHCFSLNDKACR